MIIKSEFIPNGQKILKIRIQCLNKEKTHKEFRTIFIKFVNFSNIFDLFKYFNKVKNTYNKKYKN